MIMTTQGQLILLVFGGVALSHLIAGFGESLIRKGSVELDGEALRRVNEHELRGSIIWRIGEKAALLVMVAGIAKAFFISSKYGAWGIPAMGAGFALFCLSNIARAWISRSSYERGAPGSKASRGALIAGLMTTVAELLVAGAVCSFIYAHLPKHSTAVATADSSGTGHEKVGEMGTDTGTSDADTPPKPTPVWVDANEALKILKDRNMEYLNAIAKRQDIRSHRADDGSIQYHRDDLVKLKRDGMPTWDELDLKDPNAKPKAKDE